MGDGRAWLAIFYLLPSIFWFGFQFQSGGGERYESPTTPVTADARGTRTRISHRV